MEMPRKLRLFDGRSVKVQIQWEPRNLWIGLFWRVNDHGDGSRFLHLYICILPLLLLHITIARGEPKAGCLTCGESGIKACPQCDQCRECCACSVDPDAPRETKGGE